MYRSIRYDAVVVGSPVLYGGPSRMIRRFLSKHRPALAPAVSAWDGMLVVRSAQSEREHSLRGYALDDPAEPAWEREVERYYVGGGWHSALTDGTLLYTGVVDDADGQAADGTWRSSFAAVDVSDGSLAWTLSVRSEPGPWGSAGGLTFARAGGRLIIINNTKMTALAP